jgi:hypothetical protein
MRSVTTTVYNVNELPPKVQNQVITRNRVINITEDWERPILDDFTAIAEILGVSLSPDEPKFTGFYCQGDGASFTGTWMYNADWSRQLEDYDPAEYEPYDIGECLEGIALEYNHVWLHLDRSPHTRHFHDKTVTITDNECLASGGGVTAIPADTQEQLLYQLRRLMRWYYRRLEAEHDYITSDEAVTKTLLDYKLEFLANGEPYND